MKIAPLTIEQYRSLYKQNFDNNSLFNPTASPEGQFFISEEEINAYQGEQFAWIKNLSLIDYTETMPDTTPPTMTGYGILIPTEAEALNLFPNNEFHLGGYVIQLANTSQGLAVDLAYLGWQGFRDEQDKPINATIKASFSALWYELLSRYQNNEIIPL